MVKPKYLYHGSGRRLIGDKLLPKQARDLDPKKHHNSLKGIYASSVKDAAIAMALHSCKGVREGSMQVHKLNGKFRIKDSIIYRGWPKQKYIYLYTLSSRTFENMPLGSAQWASFEPVRPEKIEKLLVTSYLHLIRKASRKERLEFFKEHKIK